MRSFFFLSVLPVDMGGQCASLISGFGSMVSSCSEFTYIVVMGPLTQSKSHVSMVILLILHSVACNIENWLEYFSGDS